MTKRTRDVIAAYVKDHPGQGPAQIASGTGLPRELVKKTVQRMTGDSQLRADGKGHYYAATQRALSLVTVPAPVTAEEAPARWRCGCCHHLQAVATVRACEFCGAAPDWGQPR